MTRPELERQLHALRNQTAPEPDPTIPWTDRKQWPDPGIYHDIPTAEYHAFDNGDQRGDPAAVISRSMLWAFHRDGPSKWIRSKPTTVTGAMDFGSLVDCLLLTPWEFDDHFCVTPETYTGKESAKKDAPMIQLPWNARTKPCQDWKRDRLAEGLRIVSPFVLADALECLRRFHDDPIMHALWECSMRQVVIVQHIKHASGLEADFKCMLDLVPMAAPFLDCLADFKTAAPTNSAHRHQWAAELARRGYAFQAACYIDAFNAAVTAKAPRTRWLFPTVENEHPFETHRRELEPIAIEFARGQFANAIDDYFSCIKSGKWPSPERDDWQVVDMAMWGYEPDAGEIE